MGLKLLGNLENELPKIMLAVASKSKQEQRGNVIEEFGKNKEQSFRIYSSGSYDTTKPILPVPCRRKAKRFLDILMQRNHGCTFDKFRKHTNVVLHK